MIGKKFLQVLVIILVVSLTCAMIYAAETDDASHNNSSGDKGGIYLSGSNNVSDMLGTIGGYHADSQMRPPVSLF